MKVKKKGKLAAGILAAMLLLAGCANEEEIDFRYEIPVDTMFEALDAEDSRTYLRCFATPVLEEYEASDAYDENPAQTICEEIAQSCGFERVVINHSILEKKELTSEEISKLGDGIKERHNVKKAYDLTVRVTVLSAHDISESCFQDITITVGKLGENWYICQSPDMEFNPVKNIRT